MLRNISYHGTDDSISYVQQREKVAEVASCIFGSTYTKEQVIDETLAIGLSDEEPSDGELRACINAPIPTSSDIDDAKKYPTAIWIEQNIALEYKKKEGKYFRGKPIAIEDMAKNSHCKLERKKKNAKSTLLTY